MVHNGVIGLMGVRVLFGWRVGGVGVLSLEKCMVATNPRGMRGGG